LAYLLEQMPIGERMDVNVHDSADMTVLHHLFSTDHLFRRDCKFEPDLMEANVKLLMRRGANLAARDNAGNTPLHMGFCGERSSYGISASRGEPKYPGYNGLQPLDLAQLEDVRELLEDAMDE
jgi:hypothetical protein